MNETYLTLNDLKTLFWRETMKVLGYDPTKYNDPNHPPSFMPVRKSWPKSGAPAWKIDEDVCFFRVQFGSAPIDKTIDTQYNPHNDDTANQVQSRTRVLNISWIFYGPNAFDRAYLFRQSIFQTVFKEALGALKIYLIPDVNQPVYAPELFEGQWWDRADFSAQFNELVKFENEIPYIKSADIQTITDRGDIRNVNVES